MSADKNTTGAWLIHHSNKLQGVSGAVDFQEIDFAGKCGILLSALSANSQSTLDDTQVRAIAKAAKLNVHTELPAALKKLEEHKLVQIGVGGVDVLGVTTRAVLGHTADIFESTEPDEKEKAVIALAEEASRAPAIEEHLCELMQDTHHLAKRAASALLHRSTEIGFVDSEAISQTEKIYYNGNLFRVENAAKVQSILNSLSPTDRANMNEVEALLMGKGCIEVSVAKKRLGDQLFDKLHSIGVFDVSGVSNERETIFFVTRPGAFGKFGNTSAEDALDLAKAFASSLTYGMTRSASSRGKIQMLNLLLDKLIAGGTLKPSTAAGQDYKILELKRVVQCTPAGRGMFTMKLLKKEIGQLAKKLLREGDVSEQSLPNLPGVSFTTYGSPEETRSIKRKKLTALDRETAASLLDDIRTGGFK